VLNRTVSDARLSLLARRFSDTRFVIACLRDDRPVPFALLGTKLRMYVEHEVDAFDGRAHTASYSYTVQSGDPHELWLARWEYLRERPRGYPYALGHLHVNGSFGDPAGAALAAKSLARLHLPTARVAFELVLRHLIAEWNVQPKTADWQDVLDESLAGFEERRTAP